MRVNILRHIKKNLFVQKLKRVSYKFVLNLILYKSNLFYVFYVFFVLRGASKSLDILSKNTFYKIVNDTFV